MVDGMFTNDSNNFHKCPFLSLSLFFRCCSSDMKLPINFRSMHNALYAAVDWEWNFHLLLSLNKVIQVDKDFSASFALSPLLCFIISIFFCIIFESFPLHPLFFSFAKLDIARKRGKNSSLNLLFYSFLFFIITHAHQEGIWLNQQRRHRRRRRQRTTWTNIKQFKLHQVTRAIHFDWFSSPSLPSLICDE